MHAHKLYYVAMERKDRHTFERVKKLLLGAVDAVLEIATVTNKKRTESSLSVGTAGQSMVLITQIAQQLTAVATDTLGLAWHCHLSLLASPAG